MPAPPPLQRHDAVWLLLVGAASLGVAGWVHSHLGLRLQPQSWLPWVAFLCLGPLIEEWALRANLLPELTRGLRLRSWAPGPAQWTANAVVSVVFAALHHSMAGPQAWLWFVPSWVLGMAWFRYRRLVVCAGLHIWFNASLALVTLGWPMDTQAQNHAAHAVSEVPMMPLSHSELSAPTAPSGAWPAVSSRWQGEELFAQLVDIEGRKALRVGRRSEGKAQVDAVATQLLGRHGQGALPVMHFEGPILHVRWDRKGSTDLSEPDLQEVSNQEWHELSFDSRLSGWPLVAYRHEVRKPAEVSGVVASLIDAKATWYRHVDDSAARQDIQGQLKALPLVGVADMPDHREYSIVPMVPKVHR